MELQIIQSKIFDIRGLRVILDKDLAELYEVTTSNLNKAVKRNLSRFPDDFMFQLNNEEFDLIFQNGTSSWGGTRKLPYAFTEHGVAMLAGLLNSQKAIEMNIQIVRAFVALRQYALGYAELNQKLEMFMIETNMQFNDIYQALTELAAKKEEENKMLISQDKPKLGEFFLNSLYVVGYE
ncbi:MAG: ORF6N domain-containing protein [Bacteroidales bacterium]